MQKVVIDQLAGRVHDLLGEKLGVRGRTLEARFKKAGRMVPRRARKTIPTLIEAERMAVDPKLLVRIDPDVVSRAYDVAVRELGEIDAGAEKSRKRLNLLAIVAFQVLVIGGIFIAIMRWRGFL